MIKMDNISIKSYVLDVYKNRLIEVILLHIQNIRFYGEQIKIKVKTLVFCENFMSKETFTLCLDQIAMCSY